MRSIIIWSLVIAFIAFVGYAWYTYYSAQPTDKSKAARMWGALVAAAGALGAFAMSWFSTPTP